MKSSGDSDFVAGFDALAQAVRRARGANGRSSNGGLSLSQYGLLEVLADRQSARVQELAARAGITASTATRILDALERRGVVRRARDDDDRRAVAVSQMYSPSNRNQVGFTCGVPSGPTVAR